MTKFDYVICKYCSCVMFKVSRSYAKKEVNKFNKYFDSLNIAQQIEYYNGNKSSIRNYEKCMSCGTCYHNFRKAKKFEVPFGSTVSPIISRKD